MGGVLLGLSTQAAHAQQPSGLYQPGAFDSADVIGNGFDYGTGNGEPGLQSVGDKKAPHFGSASASQVSASAEFEKWGADKNRFAGNRTTYLLSYNRQLRPDLEVQAIAPYQRLHINPGFNENAADGFADTELDARKYITNSKDANAPEIVASLRGFLPTGNWEKGIGLHQWGIGPSVLVSKPYNNTLGYAGLGYTWSTTYHTHAAFSFPTTNASPWYYWVGGATQWAPQWMSQVEMLGFTANDGEEYLRGLVGVRYGITPSMGVQVNYKQEFRAPGKAQTLSIGWSDLF
jgi:hypothetical protein